MKRQIETKAKTKRILARELARKLTEEELRAIGGAGTSCSGGCADDCVVA